MSPNDIKRGFYFLSLMTDINSIETEFVYVRLWNTGVSFLKYQIPVGKERYVP